MLLRTTISLLLLHCCLWASAQNPRPYFRNYSTDDGLPSSEVHYCLQDTKGYLWFATDNGVSRFDGYTFKNFGPREGLKHNVVFYMQPDPAGRIWLATMNGPLYYVEKDSIHTFSQNDQIEENNSNANLATDFFIDSTGAKYLSIRTQGILQFTAEDEFRVLAPEKEDIPRLAVQIQDRWIAGSRSVPLSKRISPWETRLDPNFARPAVNWADPNRIIDSVLELSTDGKNEFWMKQLNSEETLALWYQNLLLVRNKEIAWRYPSPANTAYKSVSVDERGRLLIGFQDGKGIRRYGGADQIKSDRYEQFLEGVSVTHICRDDRGDYWIGTLENGVFYCPDFDVKIFDRSSGFPMDHVSAFDFKNEKELFVGFRKGQLRSLDLESNRIDPIPAAPGGAIIYDLYYDGVSEVLWATNGHPNYYQNGNWNIIREPGKSTRQGNMISKRLTRSRDGEKLWGAHPLGFGAVDLAEKTPAVIAYQLGIRQRSLRVWEDRRGRIWIGNVNGLFEFKDNQIHRPEPFHEAFRTRVEDIGELPDGTLVLGTKGEGVLIWKEDYFHQLTTGDGLTANMLENIYVDNRGRIWAGTLEGLNKITRQGDSYLIEQFTVAHGLPSNEITQVKGYRDQIWVGTNKGLMQWSEQPERLFSPTPFFDRILVNNQPFDLAQNHELSHRQNDIEFHFLTVNYRLNGRIPYRFRLNAGEWQHTRNQSINFANLAPGKYQFEVQSQNEDGVWSAARQQAFVISAPFWRRGWFTALWVGGLLLISWLIYRDRINRVRRDARLEREMNELQQSALRAQMNPHFIFNCLNSIQHFITRNDQENATKYLAKFAQLIRRTLNASMEKEIAVQDEIDLLENYLELEKLRFKEKFTYRIEVDDQLDTFDTAIPPLLTQPYVENAIIHGLNGIDSGGRIAIRFRKEDKRLLVEVEDNGVGIHQSQGKTDGDHAAHRSVGMRIPQERLKLANAGNRVIVEEIRDETGAVRGTLVRMWIEQP